MKLLRTYQQETIDYCGEAISKNAKSIVITLPTGAGKTVIFSYMAKVATGNRYIVLIITESKKLLAQSSAYFNNPIVINPKAKMDMSIEHGATYIAMAQTLVRRKKITEGFSRIENLIIIIDEVHIKTSCLPLSSITNGVRLGFTATPHAKHLKGLFGDLYNPTSVMELIYQKYLVRAESWVRKIVDTSKLHTKAGEYVESEQCEVFKVGYSGLVEDLNTSKYKKCLVFTSCIEHCNTVSDHLKEQGLKVCVVHSKLDELPLFYSDYDICISVGMLTKGFDYELIDLIILFRATKSVSLFLQMCGRGSRLSDGKTHFTIIDYGGNFQRHGLWEAEREWTLDFEQPKVKNNDEDVISSIGICECLACGFVSLEKFTVCPKCGEEKKPEVKEQMGTEKVLWSDDKNPFDLDAVGLFRYAKEQRRRKWAIGIAKRKGKDFLVKYAKEAGYSDGWVYRVMNNIY